jgi:hypothetical protein
MSKRVDWLKAKKYYFQSVDVTLQDVANKFGITRQHVSLVSNREGWKEQRFEILQKADEKMVEAAPDRVSATKEKHFLAAEMMIDLAIESLKEMDQRGKKRIRPKSVFDIQALIQTATNVQRKTLNLEEEKPPIQPIMIMFGNASGNVVKLEQIK